MRQKVTGRGWTWSKTWSRLVPCARSAVGDGGVCRAGVK
jgi:hypothetical protein